MSQKEKSLKKEVEYLYIDADEDHVSLQFEEKKGDLIKLNGYKANTVLSKIVYVYEWNKGNESLWKEVAEYINQICASLD
ncbi:MAG: UPF0236 family transposase-like protein [Eubacteriales bacterium]